MQFRYDETLVKVSEVRGRSPAHGTHLKFK
jgi:hypothetical protein